MAIRAIPRVGDPVTVAFLSVHVSGVVASTDESQRSVDVMTEDGEAVLFTLNPATGRYLSGGRQTGARLLFTRSR